MTAPDESKSPNPPEPRARKASVGQVAATMFWGLCMIGKKGTWERNGVTISLPQVIVGAVIMCAVVVALLIMLTRLATS